MSSTLLHPLWAIVGQIFFTVTASAMEKRPTRGKAFLMCWRRSLSISAPTPKTSPPPEILNSWKLEPKPQYMLTTKVRLPLEVDDGRC